MSDKKFEIVTSDCVYYSVRLAFVTCIKIPVCA